MVILKKKTETSEQALIIAESTKDWEVIDYFYHSGIVFGAFMLYNYAEDKNKATPMAKFMQKNFPLGVGLLQINVVNNFAGKPKEAELDVT